MDEETAIHRLVSEFHVPRGTLERIEAFVALLKQENESQNLVSRASLDQVWSRHILDSAQLLRFSPSPNADWLDLGTGAGFPGLIVALLHSGPVTLVEERRKRADFLQKAAQVLGIDGRVAIQPTRIERFEPRAFDVISARAFAPIDRLLEVSHSFSTTKTRFILPKGRNARSELEAALASWQGAFRLEQSLTDADAQIIVAEGVSRTATGRKARGIAGGKGAR
jgi:16S rRNA (guanine527-N7)-methyltransferase